MTAVAAQLTVTGIQPFNPATPPPLGTSTFALANAVTSYIPFSVIDFVPVDGFGTLTLADAYSVTSCVPLVVIDFVPVGLI